MAAVRFIQKQGAEDIIKKGRVVFAGSITVRIKVHLQDLRLHNFFPCKGEHKHSLLIQGSIEILNHYLSSSQRL